MEGGKGEEGERRIEVEIMEIPQTVEELRRIINMMKNKVARVDRVRKEILQEIGKMKSNVKYWWNL